MADKVKSADGKGRTLWQILTGSNKKVIGPTEFEYHNPLKAKIGVSVSISSDLELTGINFFVDRIDVYQTEIGNKKFFSTDYSLRGVLLGADKPIRLRLRAIPNDDVEGGFEFRMYKLYYEMGYDQHFHEKILGDPSGEFWVNEADDGTPLAEKWVYWRKNDAKDAYGATVTSMKDENRDGKVSEDELTHRQVWYWDYSRMTTDVQTSIQFEEFLDIEMDDQTRYFTFYRGRTIEPFQVSMI
jgi:hypothetical protein